MRFTKPTRRLGLFAALCMTLLSFALNRAEPSPPPHSTIGNAQQSPPPIPKAGLLARPKLDHQLGVPAGAVAAAIPADNPQTPAKIALGEKNALDDSAKRGWELFNTRACCNKCHALTDTKLDPTFLTDNDFHNIGIIRHNVVMLACQAEQLIHSGDTAAIDGAAIQTDFSALGRFLITKKDSDIASFKTPDLRNVLVTAPYFHDGSQETLWDVMDHYNKGDGIKNPYLDEDIQLLGLSETEINDVVAFLASLTIADYHDLGVKELERQRDLSRTTRPPARHRPSLRPETNPAETLARLRPKTLIRPPDRRSSGSEACPHRKIRCTKFCRARIQSNGRPLGFSGCTQAIRPVTRALPANSVTSAQGGKDQ